MVFAPAPGVAQINAVYATPGGTAENIYHVHHNDSTAWTAAQLLALEATFQTWEGATAKPHRTAAVALIALHGRDLTTENGPVADTSTSVVGTLPGAALPDNVTIAIKKNTGLAGRGFRGRQYWIGVSQGKQTNDGYDGTETTAIANALNSLLSTINAVTNQTMCILHSRHNGVDLDPRVPVAITAFTATDTTLDSQRRRLLGHNVHR